MLPRVRQLINHYRLTPLPVEGTLFASTYRSAASLPDGEPLATGMIGLYSSEPLSISTFHRLQADELWHFYEGDPLRLILLHPDGRNEEVLLGADERQGHHRQYVVPAGVWQAGSVTGAGAYALFGCTMAPGFTSRAFEGAHAEQLAQQFPARAEEIYRFSPPSGETRMPDTFAT